MIETKNNITHFHKKKYDNNCDRMAIKNNIYMRMAINNAHMIEWARQASIL